MIGEFSRSAHVANRYNASNFPEDPALKRCLLLGLVLALGCGKETKEDPNRPLKWGADEQGGAPYVFAGEGGQRVGFEVDLAEALSKELGRPIEFKQFEFNILTNGVLRGDIDFAMNGFEVTPDRKQVVRFTRPYYLYQQHAGDAGQR